MQNQTLRPISPADADHLRSLYKMSLEKNPRGFITNPAFHGDIYDRAAQYQHSNGAMLGLFQDDTLIGFGGLKQKQNGRVELCNLHLHPHQHGKGLGKHIALALIEEARELDYQTVELHVTVTQESAIGLYKRLGFTETARKVYDVEGQSFDTVFMELQL
jgi:ribosomal protein S18 acetylase RimI-like enzyme